MPYAADLADPLLDVRNVVESFRSHHVTLPDWDETLRQAVEALGRLQASAQVSTALSALLPALGCLLTDGFDGSPVLVEQVASQVANILKEITIPGPAPEDDDWSFREASAS